MFLAGERTISRRVSPVMNEMIRSASNAALIGTDPESAIDIHASFLQRVLRSSYSAIQKRFVSLSRQMIGLKGGMLFERKQPQTAFEVELLQYIEDQSLSAATSILGTTKDLIHRILSLGEMAGESSSSIARLIQQATGLTPWRAARIARTETHSAAVFAGQAYAKSTDLVLTKVWLATTDSRTRSSHGRANLQERKMEEKYDVGGVRLMHPGDPNGPSREIVNCRCGELYEERKR